MEPLLPRLRSGRPILADGAMGTMLMEWGLKGGQSPEAMMLEDPAQIEAVTRLYIGAGAEMIQTNTFGASPIKLALSKLQDRTEEIIRRALEIAKNTARSYVYIAASCGPTGRLLKPYGDLEPAELNRSCERQIRLIAAHGADAICVETMTDINEAVVFVRAAKTIAPKIPVFATMTFDPTPRGFFTVMGVTIEKAVSELSKAGADALGANCGQGSDTMIEIARVFKKVTDKPLVIRPNAGLPILDHGKTLYPETPDYFADNCAELARLGVCVIGGCCGTTPAHIRAAAKALHL